jgi:hypothetical protein
MKPKYFLIFEKRGIKRTKGEKCFDRRMAGYRSSYHALEL